MIADWYELVESSPGLLSNLNHDLHVTVSEVLRTGKKGTLVHKVTIKPSGARGLVEITQEISGSRPRDTYGPGDVDFSEFPEILPDFPSLSDRVDKETGEIIP